MKCFKWIYFIFLTCFYSNSQAQVNSQYMIIAHRGASFDAPENTLASAKLGWEQQADAVEIDIHLSADNRIMVIHDKDTKRTTGVDLPVAATSSSRLRELDAGSWKNEKYKGEKIPFLNEILAIIPEGKKLIIEIKSNKDIVPYLKEELEKSGKVHQCEIISFDFEALCSAKNALPDIPAYFLSGNLKTDEFKNLLPKLKEYKINGFNLHFSAITPEMAKLCKLNKIPLYSWTIDDVEVAKKLIALGVIGITTNKPASFFIHF